MKKILKFIFKNGFILFLVVFWLVSDVYFTYNDPFLDKEMFCRDDFEITQIAHPEKTWDKVFFGNSVVISGYVEDLSDSGYVNMGLDCGVVTDLEEILEKRLVNVGSELVIGLNYLTLYDNFDTNKTYIWHKKWYQPYAYFERDKIYPIIQNATTNFLGGWNLVGYWYTDQQKAVYHGNLTEDELRAKEEIYQEKYYCLPDNEFDKNINALVKVADFCEKKNIKLKILWMPWNPNAVYPEICDKLKNRVEKALDGRDIEIYDMKDELEPQYFYDTGHIEYDTGAPVFTKLFDEWVKGEGHK